MPLTTGTKLGHRMKFNRRFARAASVKYRAHDTRLAHEVAVKILPDSVANGADRLRRFEQEARSIAALNHPNILSADDIGLQGHTHYIVRRTQT
jgi:serine/threonine protein kinase